MKKIATFLAVGVVFAVCLAGCGSSSADGDVADVVVDSGAGDAADAGVDLVEPEDTVNRDGISDADGEMSDATDTYLFQGPDAAFVHEVRWRGSSFRDGKWKIDYAQQFRDSSSGLLSTDTGHVAVSGGSVWAVADGDLYRADLLDIVDGGTFTRVFEAGSAGFIRDLGQSGDGVVADASGSVISFDGVGSGIQTVTGVPAAGGPIAFCEDRGLIISGGILYDLIGGVVTEVSGAVFGTPYSVGCLQGHVLVGTDSGVWWLNEATWEQKLVSTVPITSIAAGAGLVAMSDGTDLITADSSTWDAIRMTPGKGGLPLGGIVDLAVSADDRFVAVAHSIGVSLIDRTPGEAEYLAVNRVDVGLENPGTLDHFHSMRWLPAETVTDVAFDPASGDLWVATPSGLSRLYRENAKLEDKAGRMFVNLDRWFWRLGGFVSAHAGFQDAFSDVALALRDDDNDGQWTEEAVGAFCYAYRVTGYEAYYEAARKAITNMALQIDIPAVDFINAGLGRGFITRSFVRDDEGDVFTSKAGLANWHLVDYSDGHQYYWKDDTSSDELTGHFYGFSIYYDLCAKDDQERAWVAEHLTALVGYILDHGLLLLDLDGQPTEHGKYSPEYQAIAVDGLETCTMNYDMELCLGSYFGGAFLDSTEILAGLLAAWHVSGDRRFYDAYDSLITQYRYDELATFNENVLTWTNPAIANYCDHELSDLAMLTLIRYEQRDDRRQRWIDSMLAAWEFEVGERNPLKSLAMAAAVPDAPGLAAGVSTLIDFPEDQRDYLYDNSHRVDVGANGKDRFESRQFDTVLPYDEIQAMRWDANPYRVSDGGSPSQRKAPNFWLLPYWGLRYFGVIEPEVQ